MLRRMPAVLVVVGEQGDESLFDEQRAGAVLGPAERVLDVQALEREVVDVARHGCRGVIRVDAERARREREREPQDHESDDQHAQQFSPPSLQPMAHLFAYSGAL